ncbi:MAG: hypothetical protein LBR27_08230 [Bifidobacteriaceae bacterium]|nr:hypothetical protein [Bifidobacteriaceae bacterium]
MSVESRAQTVYLRWRYRDRPLPRIELGVGAWLPGWLIRVAAAAALLGLVWVALRVATDGGGGDVPPVDEGVRRGDTGDESPLRLFGAVLVVGLTLWMALWPGLGVCLTAGGVVVITLMFVPLVPGIGLAVWLYMVWRMGWWAARCQWRAKVQWRALAVSLARDLGVVALTLAVGLVAVAAAARGGGLTHAWGVVSLLVGGAALVALAWWVHRLASTPRPPTPPRP